MATRDGKPVARAGRPVRQGRWCAVAAAGVCAVVFAVAFFVARYGNEAYEQVPRGELAATDYVYAHDGAGGRLGWVSPAPPAGNTPQRPVQDPGIRKGGQLAAPAARDPARGSGVGHPAAGLG